MVKPLNLEKLQHLLNKLFFWEQEGMSAYLGKVASESRLENCRDRRSWEYTS